MTRWKCRDKRQINGSKRRRNSTETCPKRAKHNMGDYDVIFVGFPIWWYVAPTIINTFLESYDFTGKKIIPFATSGGSGMGKTNEKLAPSCKGAELLEGEMLNHFDKAKTEKWLKKLNLG